MTDAIITGLILGFALALSVGPVIFTIIKLRLNYSLSSALYFVSGVWVSDLIWIITSNFFGGLLSELIVFKKEIGIGGGIFLIGLGLFYLFIKKYHRSDDIENGVRISNTTHLKLFLTGFIINTLNPGVIALWFAATTKSLSNTFEERVIIFSICIAINICADFLKINLAGKLKNKLNEKNISIINKISGLLYTAFGILLLISSLVKY
jgi:threonine/homoserine/homoserine lactone efflux protein